MLQAIWFACGDSSSMPLRFHKIHDIKRISMLRHAAQAATYMVTILIGCRASVALKVQFQYHQAVSLFRIVTLINRYKANRSKIKMNTGHSSRMVPNYLTNLTLREPAAGEPCNVVRRDTYSISRHRSYTLSQIGVCQGCGRSGVTRKTETRK